MTWPFANIRPLSAGLILADPPWRFRNYSAKGEAGDLSCAMVARGFAVERYARLRCER